MSNFSFMHPADLIAHIAEKARSVYPAVQGRKATEDEIRLYSAKQLTKLEALGATASMADKTDPAITDPAASTLATNPNDPGEKLHATEWKDPRGHLLALTENLLKEGEKEEEERWVDSSEEHGESGEEDAEKSLYDDPPGQRVLSVSTQIQGLLLPGANLFAADLEGVNKTSTPDSKIKNPLTPIPEFVPPPPPASVAQGEDMKAIMRQMDVMFEVLIGIQDTQKNLQDVQKNQTAQIGLLYRKMDNIQELCTNLPPALTQIGGVRNEMIALRSTILGHVDKIDKVVPEMSDRILRKMAEITFKVDPYMDGAFTAVKGPVHPSKKLGTQPEKLPTAPTPVPTSYPVGLSPKPAVPGTSSSGAGYSISEVLSIITEIDEKKKHTLILPKIAKRLTEFTRDAADKILDEMREKKTVILRR